MVFRELLLYASGRARAWLDWSGKKNPTHRLVLPFQAIETTNEPRKKTMDSFVPRAPLEDSYNLLIWGDNKLVMSSLMPRFEGKVDLVYIDPPFATGADFTLPVLIEDERLIKQPTAIEIKAYRDTWGYGLASYLQMMYERLILMRNLLSDNGAIYVHLDWHIGHYVKALLDEVFGEENFRNEIHVKRIRKNVQEYETVKRLNVANDMILFYSKTDAHRIRQPKRPESKEERWHAFNAAGLRTGMDYALFGHKPPPGSHWRWTKKRSEESIAEGKLRPNPRTGRPEYLIGASEETLVTSMWDDISAYSFTTGFPTEKSEKLLGRIIEMSSEPGQTVADFFFGSGTTAAVAERMHRRWIGCDLSKFAIHVARKRLLEIPDCKPFQILNLGLYQKQKLAENGNGGRGYFEFLRELYGASPVRGFVYIHGRKGNRLVHIGPIDSFVSEREIRTTAREALNAGAKGIDILGWDFEMGLHDLLDSIIKEHGIDIRLKQIPLEVLEIRADERTKRLDEIKFFDLNYLDLKHEIQGRRATVIIQKFNIANPEFISEEVRSSIKDFKSYIDFWAVDFDFKGDTFHNMMQQYRTKDEPELKTRISFNYAEPGTYSIMTKVVDIFGNDTNKLLSSVRVS